MTDQVSADLKSRNARVIYNVNYPTRSRALPEDADESLSALRALTADAAKIAGVADRLGTLEKGRIANALVTEGDLFDERMKVKHVFVDGRLLQIDDTPAQPERRGGRGGR